jgi:uncharacterized protein
VRVPVVGLLGRTGQRRELVRSVPTEQFGEEPWGPTVERLDGPIDLDLVLEAVSGGVLVRGIIRATAVATCARCLAPTPRAWEVDVLELHRAVRDGAEEDIDASDDDLDYELVDGDTQLDLDQMVRDALVVGQPVRVLCRPDCAGLCPTCGADRNTEPCDHGDEPPADPRWAALRGLRLPPAPGTPDDPVGA